MLDRENIAAHPNARLAEGRISPLPEESRAFLHLATPGSIIHFRDVSRSLVLEAQNGAISVLSWHGEKACLERISAEDLARLYSEQRIQQIEPPGASALVIGKNAKVISIPRWYNLKPGSLIFHADGRTEEVISTAPVPFKDKSHRLVSSIIRKGASVTYAPDVRRNDKELAGPAAPTVVLRAPCSPWAPSERSLEKPHTSVLPAVGARVRREIVGVLDRLEEQAALLLGNRLDGLTRLTLRQNITQGPVAGVLEESIQDLAKLNSLRKSYQAVMDLLIGDVALGRLGRGWDPLLERIADKLEESSCGGLRKAAEALAWATGELAGLASEVSRKCPVPHETLNALQVQVRSIEETLGTKVSEPAGPAQKPQQFTRIATPDSLTVEMLGEIYQLAEQSRRDQADTGIAHRGIIIDNYYTPLYVRQIVRDGGRLITHHEMIDGKPKLTGFLLYFQPGRVPHDAKGIREEFRRCGRTACMDLICLSPDACPTAFQRLHDRMMVDLQRTEADWIHAEIMCKNEASFNTALINAALPDCTIQTVTSSPDGTDTRWVTVRLPVSSQLRGILAPFSLAARTALKKGFAEQAEGAQIGLEPMSRDEQENVRSLIRLLQDMDVPPFFTRVSFGSGNMTPAEFAELRKILEDGCTGLQGVLTWGATLMLVKIDEQQDNRARTGVHESIYKIQESSSALTLLGINVWDKPPESAQTVSFRKGDGKIARYKVISGAEDDNVPYITVEDPNVRCRLRFLANPQGSFPFWQVEAERSAEVARLFASSSEYATKIFIFGSGGGTIGHEIRRRALDPNSHVILIDGRDPESRANKSAPGKREKSSTENYIDDENWRKVHKNVHVVTSGEELRAFLKARGAIASNQTIPHSGAASTAAL